MNGIDKIAKKYGWGVDNNFAAACYNQNTIEELNEARDQASRGIVDRADIREWGITPDQWVECVEFALGELLHELPILEN